MKTSLTFCLPLLVTLVPLSLAIPPPDFGFPEAPNHTELSVTYQNNGRTYVVEEAALFGVGITAAQPVVALETSNYESISSYNGSYVLLMVDPDAAYPQNPSRRWILHWLQTDAVAGELGPDGTSPIINTTAPRVPYRGPGPPTNSSAHRYIFYAFFQHDNFTFPDAFESFNATNRASFNLTTFLDDSNLGQVPAAAQYYFASNQTGVPADFTAAAGGQFPPGNGDMITEGPGPVLTASPATSGASATGSASVTASMPVATETAVGTQTSSATGSAVSASNTGGAEKLDLSAAAALVAIFALVNLV